jgi:hypothetical protein
VSHPNHPEGFLRLVAEAKKRIKEEDVHSTKKKLDAGEPVILVDVISMDGGWRGWTEAGYPVIKD